MIRTERLPAGTPSIAPLLGAMLESHLLPGRQELVPGRAPAFGVSLTDACLGWDETEALLREAAARVR